MTPIFLLEEDVEPIAAEPIYLSTVESEYSTPNTTSDHHHESIYLDSINQVIASQLEKRSNTGTETVFYPTTPNTSMISDDEEQSNLTSIIGKPEQYTWQSPQGRNYPIQFCQHLQPVPDTPKSPPTEDQGQSDIFPAYDLPNPSTSASFDNLPNISTAADGLQNLTLQHHPQRNEWVTGCLVCRKSYDQSIEEIIAEYLNQTAQPVESVRERQIKRIKRNASIDGIQSGVFTFLQPGRSQAVMA